MTIKKQLHNPDTAGFEIRPEIYELIKEDHPEFSPDDRIGIDQMNRYRRLYLTRLIEQERGELAQIDRDVMEAVKEN